MRGGFIPRKYTGLWKTNFDRKQVDRNTLLAFLLISLVLIFTPYYMEMVNPTPKPEITKEENNLAPEPEPEDFTLLQQTAPKQDKQMERQPAQDESFIKLESDLY